MESRPSEVVDGLIRVTKVGAGTPDKRRFFDMVRTIWVQCSTVKRRALGGYREVERLSFRF